MKIEDFAKIQKQLENIAALLVQNDYITFNRNSKQYEFKLNLPIVSKALKW